jgi:hypothetical protein
MDDAVLVCGLERLGDLPRDWECLGDRNRPLGDPVRQRRPFDQLQHERHTGPAKAGHHVCIFLEPVDAADVRMIQRSERLRLALEARYALRIVREGVRQDFDRHVAIELRVARSINFPHPSHPALADRGEHLIDTNTCAGRQRHV